ncbi:MAG TPA: hypothetical protein VHK47_22010 [Polyangia bacterium]|nr:hypothetical protein [Polyangia bacterium]
MNARPTSKPIFVVCEDGREYIERFQRFLGEGFTFVPAGDFAAALAACAGAGAAGLLLDLDFRRTPPDRLVDEAGHPLEVADEGTRRRFSDSQGIYVLRALRARGVTLPAILFADLADDQQARFLERTLAPLTVLASHVGLGEISALLARLGAPAT